MHDGLIQYAILIPIIYLGIATSIDDYRFGKIYHHHILMGIGVGVAWYAMLGVFYAFVYNDYLVATELLPRVAISVLIAFVVSGSMWWFNIWSAADAKLFTVFVLLMPLSVYASDKNKYFTSMILMVNSYATAFFIISIDFVLRVIKILFNTSVKLKQQNQKERLQTLSSYSKFLEENWFAWFKTFLGLTFILMTVRLVRSLLREELTGLINLDDTLMFLFLFLAFRPLHKLFQIKIIAIIVTSCLIGYLGYMFYLDPSGTHVFEMVSIGGFAIGLLTFRQVYTYWSKLVEVIDIELKDLKEHMIISEAVKSELQAKEIFDEDEIKQLGVEGLSEEHAKRIREHYKNQDAEKHDLIQIEKTIPFAPFLFAGLIATFLVGGILVRLG